MQLPHMMALGLFIFGLKSLPYQQLQRSRNWRLPSQNRVGKRAARQFLGPGDDTITLNGTLYPEVTGGRMSLALLTAMAEEGKAWPLIEGSGVLYGLFVIASLEETKTYFFSNGEARKIDFTLKLERIDEDNNDVLGSFSSKLLALI